jgi:hypothetical protein
VLELAGLALFHLSQVDEWLFLVSSPSTATIYHLDMSALNTVRHSYPSGSLMPMELAATVEEESRDSLVVGSLLCENAGR